MTATAAARIRDRAPRDERQFVTRLVAGALSTSARVAVIHLADEQGPAGTLRDAAFEVRRIRATTRRPLRQAILLAALGATGAARQLPTLAGRDLLALEGRGCDLLPAIAQSKPDVVVIGGLQQNRPVWPLPLAERPRTAVWPLMGSSLF
jgi:hypothetical protein